MNVRKDREVLPLSRVPWFRQDASCPRNTPGWRKEALFAEKLRTFGQWRGTNHGHTWVSLLLVLFIAATVATIYYLHEEIRIPSLTLRSLRHSGEKVDCLLVSTVGNKNLRIAFSIPSKDKRQKEILLKEIPRIKHELLVSMDDPGIMSTFENRDFASMRNHLVGVVNKHLDQPVDTIYFESFYYD